MSRNLPGDATDITDGPSEYYYSVLQCFAGSSLQCFFIGAQASREVGRRWRLQAARYDGDLVHLQHLQYLNLHLQHLHQVFWHQCG